MVDTENLRTASTYINNQLLARGLLHDGQSIDFADPAHGHGGMSASMGRIISIVNDLILRRDRDAQHRESLSATLRAERADSLRQTQDIARLTERNAELQRKLNLADANETALRDQLKAAEATTRTLKDDVVRAKALIAQTRNACATETRRRDRQIDALKKQLGDSARPRGSGRGQGVTIITVTPGDGQTMGEDGTRRPAATSGLRTDTTTTTTTTTTTSNNNSAGAYDLHSETNNFLAELARGLSDENDELFALVRRTTSRLRQMSGLATAVSNSRESLENPTSSSSHLVVAGNSAAAPPSKDVSVVRPACADMTADLDAILEHLRTILTNPSFVPIEEVMVREDEINRLREGWLKMESRWEEAVHLMDGWRRRMATSGRPVNDEDLQMGIRLSPVRIRKTVEFSADCRNSSPRSESPCAGKSGLGEEEDPDGLSMVQEEEEEEEEEEEKEDETDAMMAEQKSYNNEINDYKRAATESLHLIPAPGYQFVGHPSDHHHQDSDLEEEDGDSDESSMFLENNQEEDVNDDEEEEEEQIDTAHADEDDRYDDDEDIEQEHQDSMGLDDDDDYGADEPNIEILQQSVVEPRPALGALKDSSSAGNRGKGQDTITVSKKRQRGGDFTAILEENTRDPAETAATLEPNTKPPIHHQQQQQRPSQKRQEPSSPTQQMGLGARNRTVRTVRPSMPLSTAENKQPEPEQTTKAASMSSRTDKKREKTVEKTSPSPVPTPAAPTADDTLDSVDLVQPTLSQLPDTASSEGTASSRDPSQRKKDAPPPAISVAPTPLPANSSSTSSRRKRGAAPPRSPTTTTRGTPRFAAATASSSSRLPLPRTGALLPPPQQSPLTMATIAAKLAASERDAVAARVRAKLKAARAQHEPKSKRAVATAAAAPAPAAPASPLRVARTRDRTSPASPETRPAAPEAQDQPALPASPSKDVRTSPAKRKRDAAGGGARSRAATRRRSTLNPWELQSLIAGDVVVPSPSR